MDTRTRQTKIQTAFRFDPEMLRKMKNKARSENVTLNRYVESLIERDLEPDPYRELDKRLAKIKRPDVVSPEIKALGASFKISREDLLDDDRALYIWDK